MTPVRKICLRKLSTSQVCSSAFISSNWTTPLYGFGPLTDNYLRFDRPLLSKQHQIMGWLCKDAKTIVDSYLANFKEHILVSSTTLSRTSFMSQINSIISRTIVGLPDSYRRGYHLITELMHTSLLSSAFNTDWLLEFGNALNSYLLRSVPREYANGTCNCVISQDCNESLRIGPPELVLPGLLVGCLPIDGLRLSTLECFYSSNCINTIINHLDYYELINGSPTTNFVAPSAALLVITPLNASIPSRFSPDTQIGTIVDELFIERWTNESSYERYFSECSPSICHYEYVGHNSLVYLVTSLLSLYGGLTVSLRFIVWNGLCICLKFKQRRQLNNPTITIP